MENVSNIGLTAIGGGLYSYGFTLITGDFYKGLILIGAGILVIIGAAFLNKKGVPVGKQKTK